MHATRTLFAAPGLRIHEFRCDESSRAPGREEAAATHEIALPRRGLFVRHRGRREEVADPARCLFFARGEPYRVSHPESGGDLCTVISFTDDAVISFTDEKLGEPRRPRAGAAAPTSSAIELLHRRLLRAFRDGDGERLALEESAHALLAALMQSFAPEAGALGTDERSGADERHITGSGARRRALARGTQQFVAARFRERLALRELAALAGCSPFHLCRAFRREVGVTLHRYQTRLRLRAALEALLGGASDLTSLALGLGFSDHAHFTRAFRREFGRAPSACRTRVQARELRELSKIVQAGGSAAI